MSRVFDIAPRAAQLGPCTRFAISANHAYRGDTPRIAVAPCDRLFLNRSCVDICRSGRLWRVTVTTGTIKKVVADRGFGFITADDTKEYFFHRNSLDSTLDFDRLVGGEKVEFDIEQSDKGPRANRVHAA